jgi:DNA-binding transcriptional LysR family regulator
MSIDLRLIRYAAALAEHGSFTRAADALGIAQPTLSRGIRDLEAGVGLPLFTRHRHGAEATDFGYLFLQQAAAVSAQVADLEREVALAKGLHKGELAVGFGPYAAELLLPHAMPRFVSAHPAVRIRIQVDSLEVLGRALRQRALDLVVDESTILEGDESIDIFEPCEPIKGYLFVRAGHPLAASNVSLRDALDYPLIQISRLPPRVLRPLLEALGPSSTAGLSRPVPEIDCPTVPLAVATVIGSDAAMMASLGMMKHELELGRVVPVFHESWMRTRRAFMKLRHRSHSPAATAFLAARRPCGERGGRRDAPKAMATALAAACGAGQRGLTGQARQAEPVRHRTLSTFCSSSRRIVHALASSFPQPGGKVER